MASSLTLIMVYVLQSYMVNFETVDKEEKKGRNKKSPKILFTFWSNSFMFLNPSNHNFSDIKRVGSH